ncbi:DUF1295 domain-containing protein [Salinisphaera sp. Q1T1-3]|uniref:DUF1295 domain-containing protein n=1 Tax=Salinisphaera sp. Q1T1-3 TaxID=2321229 RepID=UPI000E74ED8F|nr:DUF1295 domain-containing protein [Salinisphaera sp. Q1T1-3]RJS93749.1 DUF1295 domain-containing protein [Salinisphaera sp. Q1T1-3]
MTALAAFGLGLATALVLLIVVWFVQLFTRDASLVDVVWSASLGVIALEYALVGDSPVTGRFLMAVLALAWSLRLAGYLAVRMKGASEDSRYAAARESWGARANVYMLGFFILQAVIAAVLSLPFLVIAYMDTGPSLITAGVAILVWFVSVVGEGTADAQLKAFKDQPENRGQVCRQGLWYYSRHPNYFFESLHWVTYVVLAIGASYWWATLASPVLMALLLLKISGIPTIEGRDASEKRQGHDEYVRTTNAFFPWPPRD